MKHSPLFADLLKFLITFTCLIIIGAGLKLVLQNSSSEYNSKPGISYDSTFSSKIIKTDSTDKYKQTSTTENVSTKASPAGQSVNAPQKDTVLQKGYDLIFLGIILLIVFYSLPFLSEFSFLQLFTAKFKAEADAAKNIVNEATNAANSTVPPVAPQLESKMLNDAQKEMIGRSFSPEKNIESYISYADDPQKGKWKGEPERNDRRLSATATPMPGNNELFKVVLKVISTNPSMPLRNFVVFHLHPSFLNPNPKIYVIDGIATLELVAWGAFTVGAETDSGSTQLELDLAELPDAPMLFKSR